MAQWVDTDALKDAFSKFRAKGDARWTLKSETEESIATAVQTAFDDISSLTEKDMEEVFDAGGFSDSGGGGPN